MKKLSIIITGISAFTISILPCLKVLVIDEKTNVLLKLIQKILFFNELYTVIIANIFILVFTIYPVIISPWRKKRKLMENLLARISTELFNGDIDNHRITLFKEVGWFRANWRSLSACFRVWSREEKRWQIPLHCTLLPFSNYLMVYLRHGIDFKKSSTMFRIETDDRNLCAGVAGHVYFHKNGRTITNLPDIDNMNFRKILSLDTITNKKVRGAVKEYMERGFIQDFQMMRKLNRKAMHFFGTLVTKPDGSSWGVLLVDSISSSNPFDKDTIERLNSYAVTLSDFISLEV